MAVKRKARTRAIRRIKQRTTANRRVREQNVEAAEIAELVRRGVRTKPILEIYANRGQIDDEQYKAGISLRGDWIGMGKILSPGRIAAQSYELLDGGGYGDCTPYQIDCKARVDGALRAVGPVLSSCLENVCCHDMPAGEWAKTFGKRAAKDGISCLRFALDGLKIYYEKGSRAVWDEYRSREMPASLEVTLNEATKISLETAAQVEYPFYVKGTASRQTEIPAP